MGEYHIKISSVLVFILLIIQLSNSYEVKHRDYTKGFLDVNSDSSQAKPQGFVEPIDFTSFTTHHNFQPDIQPGFAAPTLFSAESKNVGIFNNQEFPTSFFNQEKKNSSGFVEDGPHFGTSFQQDTNEKVNFRPQAHKKPAGKSQAKLINKNIRPKYTSPPPQPNSEKGVTTVQPIVDYVVGKSSYPQPNGLKKVYPTYESDRSRLAESAFSPQVYPPEDVEVFLPPGKALLPHIKGKPKPYDGYRAVPDEYDQLGEIDSEKKFKRKTQNQYFPSFDDAHGGYSEKNGEIIYGRRKDENIEPAEYEGGIYPYYDFSDPKNQAKVKAQIAKKSKPVNKKPYSRYSKPIPQKNEKRKNKKFNPDSQTQATEEEGETEENEEEEEEGGSYYKNIENPGYTREPVQVERLNFKIPPLKIKSYGFEKYKDGDDYTPPEPISHEEFGSTVSDIEEDYGVPEFSKEVADASARQEKLRKNKNCRQISKKVTPKEIRSGRAKRGAQICYVCTDPKTGGSFEQCSYQTSPESKNYFVGSSTSFTTKKEPKKISYRYKRDLFSYDPFKAFKDYSFTYDDFLHLDEKLKRQPRRVKNSYDYNINNKRSLSNENKQPSYLFYDNEPYATENSEQPPQSYNGPTDTYEGPEETYDGPEEPYEGPAETYEGPVYAHGELVNGKYYDTREAEASENYDKLLNNAQKTASNNNISTKEPEKSPANYRASYRPKKQSSEIEDYFGPSTYELPEEFKALEGYRFGPEHFNVNENEEQGQEEEEESKKVVQKESIGTELAEEVTEKSEINSEGEKGPQKFHQEEHETAASTEENKKKEKKQIVKFDNGDICEKVKKKNMVCMNCENSKTGATYEQCQYATKPGNKYYSFGTQKSYTQKGSPNEKKEEESDQEPEKSDVVEQKIYIAKSKEQAETQVFDDNDAPDAEELALAESRAIGSYIFDDLSSANSEPVENVEESDNNSDDTAEKDNKNVTIERIEPRDGIEGLDEFLSEASTYENRDDEEDGEKKSKQQQKNFKGYDDYFHNLFPEFSRQGRLLPYTDEEVDGDHSHRFDKNQEPTEENEETEESDDESRDNEDHQDENPEHYYDEQDEGPEESKRLKDKKAAVPEFIYETVEHKKDLEKALGDFVKRDWSNCKKILKDKLTCYQCVDKNGVDNEECMYVEASAPVHKHLAYHEKKDYKKKPKKERSTNDSEEEVRETQQKRKLKKVRKPKNAKPDSIPVTEKSEETINNEKYVPSDLVSTATKVNSEEESVSKRPRIRRPKKTKHIKHERVEEISITTEEPPTTTTTEEPNTTQTPVVSTIRPRKLRKPSPKIHLHEPHEQNTNLNSTETPP